MNCTTLLLLESYSCTHCCTSVLGAIVHRVRVDQSGGTKRCKHRCIGGLSILLHGANFSDDARFAAPNCHLHVGTYAHDVAQDC